MPPQRLQLATPAQGRRLNSTQSRKGLCKASSNEWQRYWMSKCAAQGSAFHSARRLHTVALHKQLACSCMQLLMGAHYGVWAYSYLCWKARLSVLLCTGGHSPCLYPSHTWLASICPANPVELQHRRGLCLDMLMGEVEASVWRFLMCYSQWTHKPLHWPLFRGTQASSGSCLT